MNSTFQPYLRKFILFFFNDILIYSKSLEEHAEHLTLTLQILQQHSLYVKLQKCSFPTTQVEYLGHVISGKGVATNPKTVQANVQWPIPKTVSKLRGFLGITGYYRRFVKDYAKICRALHDLLRKRFFPVVCNSY